MLTIWKYKLERPGPYRQIDSPLSCEQIDGEICVWFLIDSDRKTTEIWRFLIMGTGLVIPSNPKLSFLKSISQPPFVWHVFVEEK